MRTFVELERIIWRTSKVFVFGKPYNRVLATKPEAASRFRQTLASSEALGGVAETDCLSARGPDTDRARQDIDLPSDGGVDLGRLFTIIREAQNAGANTLRQIAEALNARGIPTARGGQWHAQSVANVLQRA
jgi:Recombinase